MIVKHIPIKSGTQSSFAGLSAYISGDMGKNERVGEIKVTNCYSVDHASAVDEVLATQAMNTRAKGDKTYHLIISFPKGEKPDGHILKKIESRICEQLGFAEHQRISVVHHDTDHLHIHLAINKIHPTKLTMNEPYRAYSKLAKTCEELEKEYGLQADNHLPHRSSSENKAIDMEQHSGIESLMSWVRSTCLSQIKTTDSWHKMHEMLQAHGLEIKKHGNGLVFQSSNGVTVKASTVDREISLSKLENRLGTFTPCDSPTQASEQKKQYQKQPKPTRINTGKLFAAYQQDQSNRQTLRATALKQAQERKDYEMDALFRQNQFMGGAVNVLKGMKGGNANLLQKSKRTAYLQGREKIQANYQQQRKEIYGKYRRQTWMDWVRTQALQGDAQALAVLRARENSTGLKGDIISSSDVTSKNVANKKPLPFDNITKQGTFVYRNNKGEQAVKDDGKQLQVSRYVDSNGVIQALRLAMHKYGNTIKVTGSAEFKARTLLAAVKSQLPITFADPKLEQQRAALLKHLQQEPTDGPRARANTGRPSLHARSRGDAGRKRSTDGKRCGNREPKPRQPNPVHARSISAIPNIDSVRPLSKCPVVRTSERREVLLPDHASHNVEQQRAKQPDQLRRPPTGPVTPLDAVHHYIEERERKRQMGIDIPVHRMYASDLSSSPLPLRYIGIRNVGDHQVALLSHRNEVVVVPVKADAVAAFRKGDHVIFHNGSLFKTHSPSRHLERNGDMER